MFMPPMSMKKWTACLEEIGFVHDPQTTWWEVTDALFIAGFTHHALLAQRHAAPVLADVAANLPPAGHYRFV